MPPQHGEVLAADQTATTAALDQAGHAVDQDDLQIILAAIVEQTARPDRPTLNDPVSHRPRTRLGRGMVDAMVAVIIPASRPTVTGSDVYRTPVREFGSARLPAFLDSAGRPIPASISDCEYH